MVLRAINSLFPPKISSESPLTEDSLPFLLSNETDLSIISSPTPMLLKEYRTIAGNEGSSHNIDIPISTNIKPELEEEQPPKELNSLLWKLSIDDNSYMDPPPMTLEYNYRIKMHEIAWRKKAKPVQNETVEEFNIMEIIKYSSAFGEAFGTILGSDIRHSSYALGTGFVCCDIFQKYKNNENMRKPVKFGDEFLRQIFSYVIIPAFVVKNIALFTNRGIRSIYGCPNTCSKLKRTVYRNARLFLPIVAALIAIPIIIKPIEQFVDYCMDHTYRIILNEKKPT